MKGAVTVEKEVAVEADRAWQLYGTLRLAELVGEALTNVIHKIEVVEGDGGVGTLLKLTFPPGTPGFSSYKEKYTKVDDEKRVKEAEVVEGGYLDLGFTLYRVRFEIVEKGEKCCIIKSTVEFEVKEEAAANAAMVTIQPLVSILQLAANFLIKNTN